MAKKQSFGDKTNKENKKSKIYVKIVRTKLNSKGSGIKFNEEMLGVSPDENLDKCISTYLENKNKK